VPQAFKNRIAMSGIGSITPEQGMHALHALLSGPFDQLGFVTMTDDSSSQRTSSAQRTAVLAQQLPSLVDETCAATALTPSNAHLDAWREIDEGLAAILFEQLRSMGMGDRSGTLADWQQSIGIGTGYTRWLKESVRELQARGYVQEERGILSIAQTADAAWKRWDERKQAWLSDSNLCAYVMLVEATLRALPQILKGELAATDVVFARSSMDRVEGIYKHNEVADYFNTVLADRIARYVELRIQAEGEPRLRFLEIGAGTGGTSACVFERLQPYAQFVKEYCYTDLSRAFLLHAQEHYAARAPYLNCQLFDVERSPEEQSIEVGGYDIVIATNVLHATKDIRQTLRNAKAAMKRNGVLLVNEIVGKNMLMHLTFGLLPGWWRFEDEALRLPGSPGLSAQQWQRVLQQEGFGRVSFAVSGDSLTQQVIVAESDGEIRLPPRRAEAQRLPSSSVSRHTQVQRSAPRAASTVQVESGSSAQRHPASSPGSRDTEDMLRERLTQYLRKLVGDTLMISADQIDAAEPLETYGIDSILVVRLTDVVKEAVPNVSSTLFFEHGSIAALVEHFLKRERAAFMKLLGIQEESLCVSSAPAKSAERVALAPRRNRFARGAPAARTSESAQTPPPSQEPIAIIGMSGRYPQARTLEQYWENLEAGRDCVAQIPAERWDVEGFYCPDIEEAQSQGKSYCKWGGFIDGFSEFDPLFFSISPREAESMDPQERLFMQSCWEVLEDAGYTRDTLATRHRGRVGVFAGITKTGFELHAPELWRHGQSAFLRTSFSSVANRVSYFLNLNGPSMPIDTMCSASLTAIHEACEYLLRDECELAIAGGVNLYLHPTNFVSLCSAKMLSTSGRCKSFGTDADGMVPAEGVGTILLKRLSLAIEHGDVIHGVVRGTSINHGGKTNGYTVPNPQAQRELVRAALRKANIHARTVSYIEAHGTGTELGDPIEIAGLTQAFEQDTQDRQYCAIGSAKSNIGHAESAAGIAGVTKVLLQMKHRTLAPSLHAQALNPRIDFANSPFVVQQAPSEWRRPLLTIDGITREYPRIAGVSSFGAGGSNAHVLIEEYERPAPSTHVELTPAHPAIIVLSAKDEERLQARAQQLLDTLEKAAFKDEELADIAYTLQVGREAMEHRLALLASSIPELLQRLRRFLAGERIIEDLYRGEAAHNKSTVGVFAVDEDMQSAIDAWVEKKKYGKLLDLWTKGLAFDWERLYDERKPRRVSLPSYPFARHRYWLPVAAERPPAQVPPRQAQVRALTVEDQSPIECVAPAASLADQACLEDLRDRCTRYLKELIAEVLKIPFAKIDPN
jgi:polyketide synthase PksM